jgi:hypothetical protein
MRGRWLSLAILLILGVAGYAWWHLTRAARALDQASAMVSLSDARADCIIRRSDRKVGDTVPCSDVSAYLRDKLNLGPGASIGIAVLGKVAPDSVTAVSTDLSGHGFEVAGVIRVGFIREPRGGAR